MRALCSLVTSFAFAATACEGVPRDPEGTLDRVRGGTVRAGAVASPPWLVRIDGRAAGLDADIVHGFAATLGATVEWHWAPLEDHLHRLERFELEIVVGGLTAKTPWQKQLALSLPYRSGFQDRVFALPPGENAFLVAFDRYLIDTGASP